jgi:hypothetical protein
MENVNMFWCGDALGPINAACLRSFIRHGHRTILHCYKRPTDLPDDVELFDARQIMPEKDLIFDHKFGSPAIGADRYRYRLIQRGMGLYSDCDVFCLKPIKDEDYIFGREENNTINNAFLKFPPHSRLSIALNNSTSSIYHIPEWVSRRKKYFLKAKKALGFPSSVAEMDWGTWGPSLLTYHIKRIGLWSKSKPIDYCYSIHYKQTELLFDPDLNIEDLITHRTVAIHLWHNMLKKEEPPKGSPLFQIINS